MNHPVPPDQYAKVTEIATALHRHERTIRGYILLLHEEYGHPDFLEKLTAGGSVPDSKKSLPNLLSTKHKERPILKFVTF